MLSFARMKALDIKIAPGLLCAARGIFKKFGVNLAYLFGSRAKGRAAPESDFDIAVLFNVPPCDPLALKETAYLTLELGKILPAELDVVSLHAAPLLLKYEVVARGKVLYCEDENDRINFEVRIIKEYIDEEPIRKLYNEALYKKVFQEV